MSFLQGSVSEVTLDEVVEVYQGGNRHRKVRMKLTWARMKRGEFRALLKEAQDGLLEDDELVIKYLKGWELKGKKDVDIDFTEENLREVMDDIDYATAIIQNFFKAQRGDEKAKN